MRRRDKYAWRESAQENEWPSVFRHYDVTMKPNVAGSRLKRHFEVLWQDKKIHLQGETLRAFVDNPECIRSDFESQHCRIESQECRQSLSDVLCLKKPKKQNKNNQTNDCLAQFKSSNEKRFTSSIILYYCNITKQLLRGNHFVHLRPPRPPMPGDTCCRRQHATTPMTSR